MNTSETQNSQVTRRDFLKTTSAATVGGSILAALAGCKSPAKKSGAVAAATAAPGVFAGHTDTLKIALIGCGGRGSGAADQALRTAGPLKLVAMADAFSDRLESSLANLKTNHGDKVQVSDECKFIGFDAYKHAIAAADVV